MDLYLAKLHFFEHTTTMLIPLLIRVSVGGVHASITVGMAHVALIPMGTQTPIHPNHMI